MDLAYKYRQEDKHLRGLALGLRCKGMTVDIVSSRMGDEDRFRRTLYATNDHGEPCRVRVEEIDQGDGPVLACHAEVPNTHACLFLTCPFDDYRRLTAAVMAFVETETAPPREERKSGKGKKRHGKPKSARKHEPR